MRIEKLTQAQIDRFPEFVERWTQIGLCTAPANRPEAEAAIRDMYRIGGKPPPKIVWCGSPISQGLARAITINKKLVNVEDSVWNLVRGSVRDSVRDLVRVPVWDSVCAPLGDSVRNSVRDSVVVAVGNSVSDSVGNSGRDSVVASVWVSVRVSVVTSVYGQHDAGWLAFYSYFQEVVGLVSQTEKLVGLRRLAENAGWTLPHKNICWVSERHNTLMRDDRGRLHSLSGPACAYPDGWAIYAVHGVRVPQFVVETPKEITKEKIELESNAEIRRVMFERYRFGEEQQPRKPQFNARAIR